MSQPEQHPGSEAREPDERSEDARAGAATAAAEAEESTAAVLDQPGGLKGALEAVLMVADTPIGAAHLASVLAVPQEQIQAALLELVDDYAGAERGFELREAAGGWRYYSASRFAPAVNAFVLEGQTARLTQASLETLAVIAYRQPVSRGRIAAIRGVNVDSVVRTLLTRGLIEEAGQDEEGGAMQYRTSNYFLERLGLGSVADLPPLAPYLPDLDTLEDLDQELR